MKISTLFGQQLAAWTAISPLLLLAVAAGEKRREEKRRVGI
jgi:hypothetical protein